MKLETDPIAMARPVLGPEEAEAVREVLESGQLSLGPRIPAFEAAFAQAVGGAQASAVSSGTAGLHLAVREAGVEAGSEVVTSPFSFIATANVCLYEQATPVFVDIDPDTLNIRPDAAAAAVTDRTSLVLPVSIFGKAIDVDGFTRLGVPLVEDAAQALGARYADGTLVGSKPHLSVFAFYANKQLTTGEGGVVVSGDPQAKARMDSERNQGRAPDMDWLDHDRLGFNYRLTDLQAAIGLVQLRRLDAMLADRARVAALYHEALAELPVGRLDDDRSWFVYVVRVPAGTDRDATINALRERHGIPAKPYLPAIHLFAFYRERFGYREGQFPVAEDVAARSMALPFHPAMTEGQVARVADALRDVLAT